MHKIKIEKKLRVFTEGDTFFRSKNYILCSFLMIKPKKKFKKWTKL